MPQQPKTHLIPLEGKTPTYAQVERALNRTFNCIRCHRVVSSKHSKGGIAYCEATTEFKVAACSRCLKRRQTDTLRMLKASVDREIVNERVRDMARNN